MAAGSTAEQKEGQMPEQTMDAIALLTEDHKKV